MTHLNLTRPYRNIPASELRDTIDAATDADMARDMQAHNLTNHYRAFPVAAMVSIDAELHIRASEPRGYQCHACGGYPDSGSCSC